MAVADKAAQPRKSRSMTRLILHIGLTKTGSSAIQSWLSANSQALREAGINYADLAPDAKLEQISSGNGEHLVNFLRPGRDVIRDRELARKARHRLKQDLHQTYFAGQPTAIISAEGLTTSKRSRLNRFKALLEDLDVEPVVVAFIRNIYDHCWSGYQQFIKRRGYYLDLADFAAGYPNIQVEALRMWSQFFDDIRVLNYDSSKNDLIDSFASACEIELPPGVGTALPRVNRSLSAHERDLLIEVNRQADDRDLEFRALLSNALIYSNPEAQSSVVHDGEVIELLRERYKDDVAWVNQTFLTEDPISVEPASSSDSDPGGESTVTPEMRALIGALLDQINEPEPYVRRSLETTPDGPPGEDPDSASPDIDG